MRLVKEWSITFTWWMFLLFCSFIFTYILHWNVSDFRHVTHEVLTWEVGKWLNSANDFLSVFLCFSWTGVCSDNNHNCGDDCNGSCDHLFAEPLSAVGLGLPHTPQPGTSTRRRHAAGKCVSPDVFVQMWTPPTCVRMCLRGGHVCAVCVWVLKPSGCRVPVLPFEGHMRNFLTVLMWDSTVCAPASGCLRQRWWTHALVLCTSSCWFTSCSYCRSAETRWSRPPSTSQRESHKKMAGCDLETDAEHERGKNGWSLKFRNKLMN